MERLGNYSPRNADGTLSAVAFLLPLLDTAGLYAYFVFDSVTHQVLIYVLQPTTLAFPPTSFPLRVYMFYAGDKIPMETLDTPKTSLERKVTTFFLNRRFALLWIGQTVSKFGSWITSSGLALTAVLVLHATTVQMGMLAALGSVPAMEIGRAHV